MVRSLSPGGGQAGPWRLVWRPPLPFPHCDSALTMTGIPLSVTYAGLLESTALSGNISWVWPQGASQPLGELGSLARDVYDIGYLLPFCAWRTLVFMFPPFLTKLTRESRGEQSNKRERFVKGWGNMDRLWPIWGWVPEVMNDLKDRFMRRNVTATTILTINK